MSFCLTGIAGHLSGKLETKSLHMDNQAPQPVHYIVASRLQRRTVAKQQGPFGLEDIHSREEEAVRRKQVDGPAVRCPRLTHPQSLTYSNMVVQRPRTFASSVKLGAARRLRSTEHHSPGGHASPTFARPGPVASAVRGGFATV